MGNVRFVIEMVVSKVIYICDLGNFFGCPPAAFKMVVDSYTGDPGTPVGTPDTLSESGSVKSNRSRR